MASYRWYTAFQYSALAGVMGGLEIGFIKAMTQSDILSGLAAQRIPKEMGLVIAGGAVAYTLATYMISGNKVNNTVMKTGPLRALATGLVYIFIAGIFTGFSEARYLTHFVTGASVSIVADVNYALTVIMDKLPVKPRK